MPYLRVLESLMTDLFLRVPAPCKVHWSNVHINELPACTRRKPLLEGTKILDLGGVATVDVRGQNTRVNAFNYAGLLMAKWGGPKEPILAVCRLCTVSSTKEQATLNGKRLMPN
jgi:hypothetical protein